MMLTRQHYRKLYSAQSVSTCCKLAPGHDVSANTHNECVLMKILHVRTCIYSEKMCVFMSWQQGIQHYNLRK